MYVQKEQQRFECSPLHVSMTWKFEYQVPVYRNKANNHPPHPTPTPQKITTCYSPLIFEI